MSAKNQPVLNTHTPVVRYASWVEDALCAHHPPHLWDGDSERQAAIAKELCKRCPVQTACLQEALDAGEKWTIRGGYTAEERARLQAAS